MSRRTGRPKISSASSISPTSSLSRLRTVSFISGLARRARPQCRWERQSVGGLAFDGVLDKHEPARAPRHRPLDHQHAALGIGPDHLEALGSDPLRAQMSCHLLVLEGLPRRLALTGGAVAAMRDRNAMTSAQPAEIVPLHCASKTLANTNASHI